MLKQCLLYHLRTAVISDKLWKSDYDFNGHDDCVKTKIQIENLNRGVIWINNRCNAVTAFDQSNDYSNLWNNEEFRQLWQQQQIRHLQDFIQTTSQKTETELFMTKWFVW